MKKFDQRIFNDKAKSKLEKFAKVLMHFLDLQNLSVKLPFCKKVASV